MNLIRLLLAGCVVVAHVWEVPGYGSPSIGRVDIGTLAVLGFFAISGYLVTGSLLRGTSAGRYLWHRFVRIYPGLLVVLVLTAFVVSPISLVVSQRGLGGWNLGSAATYVVRNLTLMWTQYMVGATPLAYTAWNNPLWTLAFETLCYLGLLVLVAAGALRFRWIIPVGTLLLLVVFSLRISLPGFGRTVGMVNIGQAVNYSLPFWCGASAALYERSIPRSHLLAVSAGAVTVVCSFVFGAAFSLIALPITYLVLWAARTIPMPTALGDTDASYGVYIWGFVVMEFWSELGLASRGPWLLLTLTAAATLPIAVASWRFVERPALRLKSWSPHIRNAPPRNAWGQDGAQSARGA